MIYSAETEIHPNLVHSETKRNVTLLLLHFRTNGVVFADTLYPFVTVVINNATAKVTIHEKKSG